jgi:hypothetical protein
MISSLPPPLLALRGNFELPSNTWSGPSTPARYILSQEDA